MACGDPESLAVDETSGDEREADGWAKRVPLEAAQGSSTAGRDVVPGGITILRPNLDAIPTVGDAGPPPPPVAGAISPWGAPDAKSGETLPPRKPMSAGAVKTYRQGLRAAAAGNLVGAKAALELAVASDARSYEVIHALAVVADRNGQTKQALAYYSKALSLQPDYERSIDGVVKIHLRRGDAISALHFVEPIAQRWVRNLSVQAIYAETLAEAGRLDLAEQSARAALRRDERFVPAMLALARTSLKRGREELAESILTQALAINENSPEVHFLRGQAAERAGRIGVAMASFQKAAQIRPQYAEARTALGIQYMAAGNYSAALAEFDAAARLVPMMPEARLNLGDAYRASRRWPEAKREFDLTLRMRPDLAAAHFNLGLLFMTAGGDYPGLERLQALERSVLEFNSYRTKLGPRLGKDDPSDGYLADLTRQISREKKRIEREKRRAAQAGSDGG